MPTSIQASGTEVVAEVKHCKGDGTLIYKSKTIPNPVLPEEPIPPITSGFKEVVKYIKQRTKWKIESDDLIDTFNLIQEYEELRAHYTGNRNKDMPIKYRTGEPYPKTKEDAKREIKILKKLIKEE